MRLRQILPLLWCSLVPACYRTLPADTSLDAGATTSRQVAAPAPMRSPSLITADEVRETTASNLYDAIVQVRPEFFTSRGRTSLINEPENAMLVIVQRHAIGGLSELRNIAVAITVSVKRLSSSDVYQITGLSAPAGGVEVVLGR